MKGKSSDNILEVLLQQMQKCTKGQEYNLSIEAQGNGTVCLVWSNKEHKHISEPLNFWALNMSHPAFNEAMKAATKAMKPAK